MNVNPNIKFDIAKGDKVHVTFFANFAATELTTEQLSLEDLAERIRNASRRKKSKLPWLKLALFGTKVTKKNCLRNDENVIEVSGGELDYDYERISFDAAVAAIKELGIRALLYTSASHSQATPRWRVLTPYSKMYPAPMRAKLVARLNGALIAKLGDNEIAKSETFALSQSYFFGWINSKPNTDHAAVVIEGDYIDEREDLAAFEATGGPPPGRNDKKQNDKKQNGHDFNAAGSQSERGHDGGSFDNILSDIGDGISLKGFNEPLSRAAASYVSIHRGNPFDKEKLKALLRGAIHKAPKNATRTDIPGYLSDAYLDDIIATAERKFVEQRPITLDDFVAVMSSGDYLFIPTREMWPGKSVNACIPPIPRTAKDGSLLVDKKSKKPIVQVASAWLNGNRRVEQLSWAPGMSEIIRDRLVADGGWIERAGASIFNLYRPSALVTGDLSYDVNDIKPWYNHLKKIYPTDADHIIAFLAHRCQRPSEKINHNLLLGGPQGIGKDTILEPVKYAVGPWNFQEVNPSAMLGQFNGFLRAVILRISEARDLGEINRFAYYDHLKTITASPPDVLRVNEKNLREYYVFNCCGVITTSNHKTGGVYLPPDDRRTYVAWATIEKEVFSGDYWVKLWDWYPRQDGIRKVAAFLRGYDLSGFKSEGTATEDASVSEIVASGVPSEEIELTDLLERMGNPDALTLTQLNEHVNKEPGFAELQTWMKDRSNKKVLPHRLEQCGYVRTPNPDNKQGLWIIEYWLATKWKDGKPVAEKVKLRQQVYTRAVLSYSEQVKVAKKLKSDIEGQTDGAEKAEKEARAAAFDFNDR